VALGAQFDMFFPVVIGTAVVALLADIPAVLVGCFAVRRMKGRWARYVAAAALVCQAAASFIEFGRG
jgi:putative Ca2+/H+ antiporter (TMEM165/GDT1 family)